MQHESQLQEDAGKLAVGNAGGQVQARFEIVSRRFRKQRLAVGAAGHGLDPFFTATVFKPCEGVPGPEPCSTKASCKRTQASWQLAVQEGR